MLARQRGISLIQVAIVMASLAAVAMAFLMSARHEHNYFTDALARLTGKPAVGDAADARAGSAASAAGALSAALPPAPAGVLRKCTVGGKIVLSDVECKDGHVVRALDTRGIEAPKVPKPEQASSAPTSATDQMIEKATR